MAPPDHDPASTPSLELGDIYYTLFRHKWKIILCSLAGFALAFAVFKLRPPPYQSEAKLFIRYVITEGKSLGPGRDDTVTKSPDQRGETIIKSELEILTSMDLAEEVAKTIGPEKILTKPGDADAAVAAAITIQRNLFVEVPLNSSVIRVVFQHRDPTIVQAVLGQIVKNYLRRHVEIHRAVGIVGDFLTQETDQLRARLAQTEEELRKAMNKANVISLEDSKKTFGEQIARLRQQISDAQVELAERSSVLQTMTKDKGPSTETEKEPPPPTAEQVAAYQKVAARLAQLQKREQDYLANFTEESVRVREARAQIAEAEEQKKTLEAESPALTRLPVAIAAAPNQPAGAYDPQAGAAQINALQARIKVLNAQLDEVRAEATKVDELEISILELRRRKELEEANYRYYSANLEQSRINEALGTGRVSNISLIEAPTPPLKDWAKTTKTLAALVAGGFFGGLAWAFLIEFYFDRSVRRPADIERTLGLPLFLSIPKYGRNGRLGGPKPARTEGKTASSSSTLALMPGGGELALNPFYETLRDRLVSYFESINLRHKPKLVAVTGLGKDTGVTTVAAGLARSLSETGEGNVLLVDMTQDQGSAQHFHKGTTIGLDQIFDTRKSALVQENLYVVGESSSSAQLAKGMPQRFNQLVPKLKTSDFDYIIFDMPPVSQISITPRLASFMDMVLMVIESEKTDRDIARRAAALLAKSNANVGVILNKSKSYVPSSLHQDREFLLGT